MAGGHRPFPLWSRLYEIERRAKQEGYDAAHLLDLRQKESRPILAEMYALLETHRRTALPRSPLGQAVTYALNQ
ncbi:MAG: transposase [Sedimentisphaerales bacterium]|nr:transposase [Sedimentisphaerales bacterium]